MDGALGRITEDDRLTLDHPSGGPRTRCRVENIVDRSRTGRFEYLGRIEAVGHEGLASDRLAVPCLLCPLRRIAEHQFPAYTHLVGDPEVPTARDWRLLSRLG